MEKTMETFLMIMVLILIITISVFVIYLNDHIKESNIKMDEQNRKYTEFIRIHNQNVDTFKKDLDKQSMLFRSTLEEIDQKILTISDDINSTINEVQSEVDYNDKKREEVDQKQELRLNEIQKHLDDSIEQNNKYLSEFDEGLKKLLSNIIENLKSLQNEQANLKKKIEHFTEIKEDSNKLNETIDLTKENEMINSILNKEYTINDKYNSFSKDKITTETENLETIIEPESTEETLVVQDSKSKAIPVKESFIVDNNVLYDVVHYDNVVDLHNKLETMIQESIPVYIKINELYKNESFRGTVQEISSITKLYPDNNVFYLRFGNHSISITSVEYFLTTEEESKSKPIEVVEKVGLDEQQQKAYEWMEKSKENIFISGKAGTGKSFLLKLFTKGTKKRHLIVAPTGIAALNVGGVTIHSAFGYDNLMLGNELTYIKLKKEKMDVLKFIDALIIDEVSMVRADMLDKIDYILKRICGNNKLFGGKQIIAFGDLFQLPPIVNGNELKFLKDKYDDIYFFNAEAYKNGQFKYIELTINHRQNGDNAFFEILNKIRIGQVGFQEINLLNNRYTNGEDLRRVLKLFPKKENVEYINSMELSKIPAKEYQYEADVEFASNSDLTKVIENTFPISTTLLLKVGALVMMVKNDINQRWVNGTLGIVSYLDQNKIKVTIDSKEYDVQRESFENKEARYIDGKIEYITVLRVKQFPIVLAYAITIHKSQGMTYKTIACDLKHTFESGQSYVALSRCSSLDGLHLLSKITGQEIKVSPVIKSFYENVGTSNES